MATGGYGFPMPIQTQNGLGNNPVGQLYGSASANVPGWHGSDQFKQVSFGKAHSHTNTGPGF